MDVQTTLTEKISANPKKPDSDSVEGKDLADGCEGISKPQAETEILADNLEPNMEKFEEIDFLSTADGIKCTKCPYTTKIESNIISHLNKKHAELKITADKWLNCAHCEYKVRNVSFLQLHLSDEHSEVGDENKWFYCDHCSFKSTTQDMVKRHELKKHEDSLNLKWFDCGQCEFKCKTKTGMKRHLSNGHVKRAIKIESEKTSGRKRKKPNRLNL